MTRLNDFQEFVINMSKFEPLCICIKIMHNALIIKMSHSIYMYYLKTTDAGDLSIPNFFLNLNGQIYKAPISG